MKTKKIMLCLLAVCVLLSCFAGCGKKDEPKTSEGEIVLTDMMGNEVKLAAPAKSVAVLTAADCEIVYALGAGDSVVARGEYCDYPEEVLSVQSVKSGSETNIEEIVALKPELLIAGGMDQDPAVLDKIREAGIPVLVTYAQTIDGTYEAISLIGKALGKDSEAEKLVSDMKASFDAIKKDMPADGAKTVYFEVSPLEYGLWTAGNNTFMNELCEMLGVKNAFADVEGWAEISQEQVIERNPDYIVTITMYYGEGPKPEEEIASRDGWQDITAVKEGKILNADSNQISRPGPRLCDAAKELAEFFN